MENLNDNIQHNLLASSTSHIPRMLSRKQVIHHTGLGNSTIYSMLDKKSNRYDSTFPCQVNLSRGRVAWVESEIVKWLEDKMEARFQ